MKVARHVAAAAEQVHRRLAVTGMVLIFLHQSPGGYGFPLTGFIQTFTEPDHNFAFPQSVRDVAFIIHAPKQYDVALRNQLPAEKFLFVKQMQIGKLGEILPPAHFYPFLRHRLRLHKEKVLGKLFPHGIAERNLMMIDVIGHKYDFHTPLLLLYASHMHTVGKSFILTLADSLSSGKSPAAAGNFSLRHGSQTLSLSLQPPVLPPAGSPRTAGRFLPPALRCHPS